MKQEQPIDVCRQDEHGIDLQQIEYNLSLTPAERIEQHYRWRIFVQQIQEGARRYYGSAVGDPEAAE